MHIDDGWPRRPVDAFKLMSIFFESIGYNIWRFLCFESNVSLCLESRADFCPYTSFNEIMRH
jgi:hypothetical protein